MRCCQERPQPARSPRTARWRRSGCCAPAGSRRRDRTPVRSRRPRFAGRARRRPRSRRRAAMLPDATTRAHRDAESSYANLVREITGLPLVGMTLAGGDTTWSARHWDTGTGTGVDCTHATNVRVIGDRLAVSWNDALSPPPAPTRTQTRTISAWGPNRQADLARRRVLVVGAGSVGLDVAARRFGTEASHCHGLRHRRGPQPRPSHRRRAPRLSAGLLAQYVSLSVAPAGIGEPGPLQYSLNSHFLDHRDAHARAHCPT